VKEVEACPCKGKLELVSDLNLCVTPLRLEGIRGKKSTPSIGWEVPVKYQISRRRKQTVGLVIWLINNDD
jgi:hypothetical protein